MLIKSPPKEHPTCPEMKFDEKLSIPLLQPHTDPVVVSLKIDQMKVRRVLVDTGSTTDLITMDCLRQMKYEEKHLQPIKKPLIGFGGGRAIPLGTIVLPMSVCEKNKGQCLAVWLHCSWYKILLQHNGASISQQNQSRHSYSSNTPIIRMGWCLHRNIERRSKISSRMPHQYSEKWWAGSRVQTEEETRRSFCFKHSNFATKAKTRRYKCNSPIDV